jgi:hypothetical protein
MNTPEHSEQELLDNNIIHFLQTIRTGIPGKIISTDGKKATVQPLVDRLWRGEAKRQAVLTDVPVWRLGTQTARVSVPLNPNGGDYCIINFCERPIDTWVTGDGEPKAPKDGGNHDERGAWIMVGLEPFQEDAIDLENLVVEMNRGTDQECTVIMKPTGDVTVKSPTEIILDAPVVKVTGNLEGAGEVQDSLGKLSRLRTNYNTAQYVGNLGAPTSITNKLDQ